MQIKLLRSNQIYAFATCTSSAFFLGAVSSWAYSLAFYQLSVITNLSDEIILLSCISRRKYSPFGKLSR